MKKVLTLLTTSVLLFSCKEERKPCKSETKVVVWKLQVDSTSDETLTDLGHLEILIIDSCEYIYTPNGSATTMTHKGNCKNHKK